jgi:uncharacterized iron-regulated protein
MKSVVAFLFVFTGCQLLAARVETVDGKRGNDLWQSIGGANVIYLGEIHDNAQDHAYQIAVIRDLIRRKMPFGIGWEMFDVTQQRLLDDWDRGSISLQDLLRQTGFDRAWGVYTPVYAEILQLARNAHRRNLALNAPPVLVKKVAHRARLSSQERAMLPRGFVVSRAAYKNFVGLIGDHPGMPRAALRSFFEAQNVWDQTMAEQILSQQKQTPGIKLVVLTGLGHISNGFGIPFYVAQKSGIKQVIVGR